MRLCQRFGKRAFKRFKTQAETALLEGGTGGSYTLNMTTPTEHAPEEAKPQGAVARGGWGPGSAKRDGAALVICFLLCALHFSDVVTTLVIGLMTAAAYQVFYRRNRKVILLIVSVILSLLALSYFGKIVIRRAVAVTNQVDVDHRTKPNKAKGINADGFRCAFEAQDFTTDTFNILCLGDSFTYGWLGAQAEDAYPQVLERMIAESHPARQVRTVNCGWVSCSPLLAKRALVDYGKKYKPSLVTYGLDMTDFQDDLRYAYCDRDDIFDVSPVEFVLDRAGLSEEYGQLRRRWELARYWQDYIGQDILVPYDKFFIVNQPLEKSRPFLGEIELNLQEINRYCREELKVPFVLIVFPRSFQLNDKECPKDKEARFYTVLGPYVFEPFRWLDEFKTRVGFPCYSLLEDFKQNKVFPICFENDAHWNPAGHRVAAEAILKVLRREGYAK